MKYLIINADDFGMSQEVNDGIKQGIKAGMITSVSLLVNMPCIDDAIHFLHKHPEVSVGLHFNITEGPSLSKKSLVRNLIREDGNFYFWSTLVLILIFNRSVLKEVYTELSSQYQQLHDKGIHITHIDSHHHIHLFPPVFGEVIRFAQQKNIKALRYRLFNLQRLRFWMKNPPSLKQFIITTMCLIDSFLYKPSKQFYEVGSLYDIAWHSKLSENTVVTYLTSLTDGTTELICHPAVMSPTGNPKFLQPRYKGLSVLLSKKIKSALKKNNIHLTGRVIE